MQILKHFYPFGAVLEAQRVLQPFSSVLLGSPRFSSVLNGGQRKSFKNDNIWFPGASKQNKIGAQIPGSLGYDFEVLQD